MPESDLVVDFQRVADGDPGAPPLADLLAELQAATERGVEAVEAVHDHAADDAATLDPAADPDAYVDVVETVEDVGYLVDRVNDQVALVSDLVAAATTESDEAVAERVVDFVEESDGMLLPSERAERYRDAVVDEP
jgi:methyl-accepting chemotaxis protein